MEEAVAPRSVETEEPPDILTWALLAVGVASASVSAILIRYATGAEPLAVSFWRCAAGALALWPFALPGLRGVSWEGARTPAVSGGFLALHFATWITSLELTSVASSVLLVSTTPIFVAVASRWLFGERVGRAGRWGIALALAGTALISGGDWSGASVSGSLLALAGGATAAGYVLAGRRARREHGILQYATIAYSAAAVMLLVVCLAAGVELNGYPAATWWALAALVVGPQLLGHTVINLVLGRVDATTVSISIMAEPVIAIGLALVLFDEVPSELVWPGGAAILLGIYMVSKTSSLRTGPSAA